MTDRPRLIPEPAANRSDQQTVSSSCERYLVGSAGGGRFFAAGKRRDVVLFVDGENRHMLLLESRALRGHHISHSELLERQDNCAANRRWRRIGDEGQIRRKG